MNMKDLALQIFLIGLTHDIADNDIYPIGLGTERNESWSFIYPGTKWCGKGDKAKHDNDFGEHKKTDKCCRDHDRCPHMIKEKTRKYGIHNNGSVTILSCQCDETFYHCLKGVRTEVSNIIGTLYFDILKNECFKQSPENDEGYVLAKNRNFSKNKLVRLISKLFR